MEKDFITENNVLIKYTGTDKIIKIPENIKVIGANAFYKNKEIKEIIMSNNIYKIEEFAFYGCENLKEIKFSANLKEINEAAFYGCGMETLKLKNIKTIRHSAFGGCVLLEYVELENIENIEEDAFTECDKLKKAKVNVKKCGTFFSECQNLKIIECENVSEDLIPEISGFHVPKLTKLTGPNIICEDGVVYNKEKTKILTYLEGNNKKTFKVPDNVEIIGENSFFSNKNLEKIILGKNVKEIKFHAILLRDLKEIVMNSNLEKLNKQCIRSNNLNTIDLSNTKIKDYNTDQIITSKKVIIKLPKTIQTITTNNITNQHIQLINNNPKATIIGNSDCIETLKLKTLEELIDEGKTFIEASQIIKNYER